MEYICKPHLAEKKKIDSAIKKVFLFSLSYILPFGILVYTFMFIELSKFFVFMCITVVAMLLFSFLTELHFSVVRKLNKHKVEKLKNENIILKLISLNFKKDLNDIKPEELNDIILKLKEELDE